MEYQEFPEEGELRELTALQETQVPLAVRDQKEMLAHPVLTAHVDHK